MEVALEYTRKAMGNCKLKSILPKMRYSVIKQVEFSPTNCFCPKCQKQFIDFNHEIDDSEGVKTIIFDNVQKNRY